MQTLHEAVLALFAQVQERYQQGGVAVVGDPTGFEELDQALGGWRRKAVYVLAGRPGMGKSAAALTLALDQAQRGKKVMVLSMEMASELLALRVISGLARIPAEKIEKGDLTAHEFTKVKTWVDALATITFSIIDTNESSVTFRERMLAIKQTDGIDFVVADYASLFQDRGSFGENERLSRVSGNMRAMSNECDCTVLLLSQLNRKVDERAEHRPMLSDIRDSGALEQDAFAVIFVYRPHYYAMMEDNADSVEIEEDAEFIIAKNRQGQTGIWNVRFIPREVRWASIAEFRDTTPQPNTALEHTRKARGAKSNSGT